ncbi:abortive infection family protein [Pedobacter lithocola]|uniref:Abortive infection family protein n=1 Tax=Pedobacter lithocola TaxID=1908239 RepID=A0ABV8PEB1_9SPHI
MDRLKLLLENYSRWQPLYEYINRIEGFMETDFSICIENSKSLLESIAKEICKQRGQLLDGTESVGKILGYSFGCLGYPPTSTIRQIGSSVANVGQQMGNFRNEIGTTSHGRTLDELEKRKTSIQTLTGNFLVESTDLVCSFLIEAFETDNPAKKAEAEDLVYGDNEEFNEDWDQKFDEFEMGEYSFPASEILFYNDPNAYKAELYSFNLNKSDEENNN